MAAFVKPKPLPGETEENSHQRAPGRQNGLPGFLCAQPAPQSSATEGQSRAEQARTKTRPKAAPLPCCLTSEIGGSTIVSLRNFTITNLFRAIRFFLYVSLMPWVRAAQKGPSHRAAPVRDSSKEPARSNQLQQRRESQPAPAREAGRCCAVLCLCSARGVQPHPQAVRRGRCPAACQGRARGHPGKGAGWAGHLVCPPSQQCQELLWLWFLSQSCQGTHCVRSWGAGQKMLPLNSVENTKELAAAAALLGLTHGAAAYPLLVNVSQEDAALPVVLLPQRVVPVLCLHQTGKRKQRSGQEPGASHAPAAQ